MREQTGMHCLEIILGQVYQSGKVVSFWLVFFVVFFSSTDPVSVTGLGLGGGAHGWVGGNCKP